MITGSRVYGLTLGSSSINSGILHVPLQYIISRRISCDAEDAWRESAPAAIDRCPWASESESR